MLEKGRAILIISYVHAVRDKPYRVRQRAQCTVYIRYEHFRTCKGSYFVFLQFKEDLPITRKTAAPRSASVVYMLKGGNGKVCTVERSG